MQGIFDAIALGVPVVWEDREWFRIDRPLEDTVQAIHRFLLAERERLDPTPPEVKLLDSELRRWAAGEAPLSAEELAEKKARLRRLSPRLFFHLFPEELNQAARPLPAADPARDVTSPDP